MRSTVIWSFLSLVTLAAGGLISGCDSDAKIAKSAEGESCDKTADCNDGLRCRDQVCVKGSGSGGSDSGDGGDGPAAGGSGAAGPGGPVLSTEGESCTKRADCEEGLACFNQRCVADAGGEGGGGNLPEVRLGALGETCEVTADCEDGLACVPGGYPGVPVGYPGGFLGVCSSTTGGAYQPTGMDCNAECKEATDCCELPIGLHASLGAESCADLAVLLDGVNCAAANVSVSNQPLCFAQAVYCECGASTWECNAGQCVYAEGCTENGLVLDGCPTLSRSDRTLVATCNDDGQCAPPEPELPCSTDGDCDTMTMADLALACNDGECTCYKATGSCYRRCDRDLDCAPGKVCDADTSVCVTAPACTTDEECTSNPSYGPKFRCVEDMCQMYCATDYDCNAGAVSGITTLVCAADHVCRAIGCSTDAQCFTGTAQAPGVKMFCTAPEPVEAGMVVSSAITGGTP